MLVKIYSKFLVDVYRIFEFVYLSHAQSDLLEIHNSSNIYI